MWYVPRFAVREKYPVDRGKERSGPPSEEFLKEIFQAAKPEESLKKILNPQFGMRNNVQRKLDCILLINCNPKLLYFNVVYGPAIIEHCLLCVGLSTGAKLKDTDLNEQLPNLKKAFEIAETIIDEAYSKHLKV